MLFSTSQAIQVEKVAPHIRVLRFRRSDYHDVLYDGTGNRESPLYREVLTGVLRDLSSRETLIVNLKNPRIINSTFYECLLKIRQQIQSRNGRLLLCNLNEANRQIFELFHGFKIFKIFSEEEDAIAEAIGRLDPVG